jgi:hypothetical protein
MKQLIPPPIVLVKTWLGLSRNSEERDTRLGANHKLVDTFGSAEIAVIYLEQQGLKHSA